MFKLEALDSSKWEEMRGAGGNIVNLLKEYLEEEDRNEERLILEDLAQELCHQLSFYDATYLVLPYLIKRLFEVDCFEDQFKLVSEIGNCLATDCECTQKSEGTQKEIINHYNQSINELKVYVKKIMLTEIDKIKRMNKCDREYFAIAILAILGDRNLAYCLANCAFEYFVVLCPDCGNENEEMEDIETMQEYVEPIQSVLGLWDKEDFSETYKWFSNYLMMIGLEQKEELIRYCYGTYTCLECGKKHPVNEIIKYFYMY